MPKLFRLIAIVLLAVAGCSSHILTPDPKLRPTGMVPANNVTDWQTVLTRIVTPQGYVRWSQFDDIKSAARPALERYLALLEIISPENRPDLFELPSDQTAYWINAYNAACLYGEIRQHDLTHRWDAPTAALYGQDHFLFGGHSLSLHEIETSRLNEAVDPRILFALNRCTKSSPPLRNEPYFPNKVNYQLNDQSAKCLADPRFVIIHARVASLNQDLIVDHRQDFLAAYQLKTSAAGTLLQALQALAGRHGNLVKASNWISMPYDGSLNSVAAAPASAPTTSAAGTSIAAGKLN